MLSLKNYLLLSTQVALLGHVVSELRAVTVDLNEINKLIILHFFYDCKVNDKLFELASCASAEMDLGPDCHTSYLMNDDLAIQLDYPTEIPVAGKLVYLRREPFLPNFVEETRVHLLTQTTPTVILLLDIQEALLGKVTPALREVSVDIHPNQKRLFFYFIYDGEVSKEDFHLAHLAIAEVSQSFPGFQVDKDIERIDSPAKITRRGQRVAFARKE